MDRIDLRKYLQENRVRVTYGRRIPPRRERIRRRPRTPDSYATLAAIMRDRWRLWLEQGRIEVLGPRHYRIHLSAPRGEPPPEEA
jgi:hypothetical protein